MSNCPECGGPAKTDPDFPYYPIYDDSELRALRERYAVLERVAGAERKYRDALLWKAFEEWHDYWKELDTALAALKEKP